MELKKIRKLIEDNQLRTKEAGVAASEVDTSPEKDKKVPAGKKDVTPKSSDANPNPKLPPVTGKTTMTGQQPNNVDLEPGLYPKEIKEGRTAVVTFGRFNPPTIAHERIIGLVEHFSKECNGTAMVYMSRSCDAKKNPMMYESKLSYARYAFGNTIRETPEDANDVLKLASHISEQGYDNLVFVAGSDRVPEIERKLNMYNGDLYEFANIIVQSAGERDPDSSDNYASVSASALRESAGKDDFVAFKAGLAKSLRYFAEEIYAEVRGELHELNASQRMKRAIMFRRNKARVKAGLNRAIRRRAPSFALGRRSRRLAIKLMRRRILRGKKYRDLSYAQRALVDARLKRRKKSIAKIARRLLPRIARAEASRKLGTRFKNPMAGVMVAESNLLELASMIPEAEYDYELTEREVQALQEKAAEHETSYDILETVFRRGIAMWENIESDMTFSQYGFGRVNSFLHGGKAYDIDFDLVVEDCEDYASTKDDEEDANGDGMIEGPERAKIDARVKEKIVTNKVATGGFHRHHRDSVIHRTTETPGKPKRAELIRKIYETVDWSTKNRRLRERRGEDENGVPNLDDGMGKRRCDMPQLTNFDAFHKDLTDSGHQLGHDYVKPDTLTPTQKHFNREKVDALKKDGWGDKGIIISNDNYVVDGHHRWLAAHEKGEKIKARRTSLSCDDLLDFLKGKPYVEKKNLDEQKD